MSSFDSLSSTITLSDGTKQEYSNLIVATGSIARTLPIEGGTLGGIYTMRSIADAAAINAALGSDENVKKNLVIVGSSFIGMEMALACSKRANVSVVGKETVPFQMILGEAVGRGIQKVCCRLLQCLSEDRSISSSLVSTSLSTHTPSMRYTSSLVSLLAVADLF